MVMTSINLSDDTLKKETGGSENWEVTESAVIQKAFCK